MKENDPETDSLDQNTKISHKKPTIMLQHGFDDSGYCWISHRQKSPAFLLVNKGYDVWINNNRGSLFSRMHKYLGKQIIHKPDRLSNRQRVLEL